METVKIKNEDAKSGYTLINKEDFNEKKHQLFEDESADQLSEAALSKLNKAKLLETAEREKIELSKDDLTNREIVKEILAGIEKREADEGGENNGGK